MVQVLTEFVDSDYAKRLYEECNVQPLIGCPAADRIKIMFDQVKLEDTFVTVRLHRVFEQRSEKLLRQLVIHLRARMPKLERLLYEAKSPPSTRTIII